MIGPVNTRLGVNYLGSVRKGKVGRLVGESLDRAWRVHAHCGKPEGKWIHFVTRDGRRGKIHQTSHEVIWKGMKGAL